ncbi:ty3-gypsy retrotransposon protein [Cucumis melo var. makuwa]|nr:ty3-gypsy retrotransposon protein [Cucumis melo var. makuwa]
MEDQLVRQFVRSLKGNAFEWYTDIEQEVIDSWEQLEKEFLNRFYSTRRTKCAPKACIGDSSTFYKPCTFEELATRAHDMELSIANRGTKDFPVPELRKDKKEIKSAEKVVKSTVKESMVEEVYPFSDLDIADMLEQLLEKQLIQLSECKRPEQAEKVDDPNYCKYHRVISHLVEKCSVLKELILRLAREKNIDQDLEEFRTFEPVVVRFHQEVAPEDSQEKERLIEEDDEGWTVVTRRKKRKSTPIQKEPRFYRNYRRVNKAQKNKKKKKTRKLKLVHEEDKDFPRTQRLVTLADFFPTRFLGDHQNENPGVVACHAINATEEEASPASSSSAPIATYESTPYCMSIDFSDEDLLLGSKLHNRPLYVSRYVREQRVDRILVNNGSAVNIMPKSTMRQLGILMEELSNSKLVIQGFNQGSKRVIGMIRLELLIGDLKASALFHAIDSRTTYKLLLGRPWIHGNGVVTWTLHQCLKFYQDGVKKVEADSNPFSEAESHFADAKFYLKNDGSPEVVSVVVPLVNRDDNLQLKSLASREPHKSTRTFHSGKSEASTSTAKSVILMDEKTSNPPILCYAPLSRRKKGE